MKKRIISLMMIVSLLLVTCLNNKVLAVADNLDVWTEDALVKVALADTIPADPSTEINLVTARNEYENAQIALRSTSAFTVNGLTFTDLTDGTNTISSANLTYNYQLYDMIGYDSKGGGNQARFYPSETHLTYNYKHPDPLSNASTINVLANETQPIWIKLYTPKNTPAGTYTGKVIVHTTEGTKEVTISVEVCNVTLPEAKDSDFKMYNWAATNTYSVSGQDFGQRYYGIEKYTPEWWALMEDFAERMVEQRQNMAIVWTLGLLLDAGTTVVDNGSEYTVNFDWTYFDQFVEIFQNAGMKYFGGDHLAAHWQGYSGSYNMAYEEIRKLGIRDGKTDIIGGQIANYNKTALDADTEKWLNAYLPALKTHLEEKGWADLWYQHILDEPNTLSSWSLLANKLHEYGFKTIDADASGKLAKATEPDVYVPLTNVYELYKNDYDTYMQNGKEVFMYVCVKPRDPWLNRFVDQPRLTNQLLFWYAYRFNFNGYLHWAWNPWHTGVPIKTLGDTMIVYPDKENMTVMSSVRNEVQRDGVEDIELFKILEKVDAAKAASYVNALVLGGNFYSEDIAYIRQIRNNLVRAAAGQEVAIPEPYVKPDHGFINDTDDSINWVGEWTYSNARNFGEIEDDATYTMRNNDYVEYTFQGTGIDVIAAKSSGNGDVDVWIDDKFVQTINNYSANREVQSVVFSKKDLANGTHIIKLIKKGASYMNIDAFKVYEDAPINTPVTINNTDAAINYEGPNWRHESNRNLGEHNDDASYTTVNGESVSYEFEGTGIEVIAAKNFNNGKVDVFIDGMKIETINNYAPQRAAKSVVFSKKDLADGIHTIKLVKVDSQYMNLDAFKVY